MLFDINWCFKTFWEDYWVWWFIIGLLVGLTDLKMFYKEGNNITLKNLLDLLFFSCTGFVGLMLFLFLEGNNIILIKNKK
jgi:hypothetical protein